MLVHRARAFVRRPFAAVVQLAKSIPKQAPRRLSAYESGERWNADPTLVDCAHFLPATPMKKDDKVGSLPPPVVVYPNVIDTEEQELLETMILAQSTRHRYQKGHWDAVIIDYREFAMDTSYAHNDPRNIVERIVQGLAARHTARNDVDWLPPHVIDLKANGEIRPHVDSVRFSGDLVCGLSLLSTAIMRLEPSVEDDGVGRAAVDFVADDSDTKASDQPDGHQGYIDVLLPPRSLYVLQGDGRYRMTHALRPSGSVFEPLSQVVQRDRRLSVILRDAKHNGPNEENTGK